MRETVTLPPLDEQAETLIELGVAALLRTDPVELRKAAAALSSELRHGRHDALLVPSHVPCDHSDLVRLISRDGKPGFIVEDFTDSVEFVPTSGNGSKPVELPGRAWYLLEDPRRGDEFQNASPAEALDKISSTGRVPLTIIEGIFWVLQDPEVLARNKCFMTIGSRKPKPGGTYDARTAALWISNGTGRDGKENRNAPKLGWCWWNNRHTWLGIAHGARRTAAQ